MKTTLAIYTSHNLHKYLFKSGLFSAAAYNPNKPKTSLSFIICAFVLRIEYTLYNKNNEEDNNKLNNFKVRIAKSKCILACYYKIVKHS